MKKIISRNPAINYEVVGEVLASSPEFINEAIRLSNTVKTNWANIGVEHRIELLKPLIKKLEENKHELSITLMSELGKPITQAREEVDDAIEETKYFIDNGIKFLEDELFEETQSYNSLIVREPYGVAAVIAPWNYPLEVSMWGVVPNLLCGNTVIYKPSEETPLLGQKLADIIKQLDIPKGVFEIIQGDKEEGNTLVNGDINLLYFIGSSGVGKRLYEIAGQKFIKSYMSLGGNSPTILFDDIEVTEKLINSIVAGRFTNCGQICSAIKRLYVQEGIYDEIVDKVVEKVKGLKMGLPSDETTQLTCLANKKQFETVQEQVSDSIRLGAKVECGAEINRNFNGAYYQPTVLTNVNEKMKVIYEEVFGPVLPIVKFKTEDEAVSMANDSEYGLSAQVYSKDTKRVIRVGKAVSAGRISLNFPKPSGIHCATGGYKLSGHGRQHGKWSFHEFTQIKNLFINKNY